MCQLSNISTIKYALSLTINIFAKTSHHVRAGWFLGKNEVSGSIPLAGSSAFIRPVHQQGWSGVIANDLEGMQQAHSFFVFVF
jgi:hypothetical protein